MSTIPPNNIIIQTEWKVLAGENGKGLLLFNNRIGQLERKEASDNKFVRFFQLTWYYMNGYTTDSNKISGRIKTLIDQTPGNVNADLKNTIQKVGEVIEALIQGCGKDKTNKKLALTELKNEMLELIKPEPTVEHQTTASTPSSSATNVTEGLYSPRPDSQTPSEVETPPSTQPASQPSTPRTTEVLLPTETSVPNHRSTGLGLPSTDIAASPAPQVPPAPVGAPPPPPPLGGAENKILIIANKKKEIEQKQQLISYLKFCELKNTNEYKNYNNAKSNFNVIQGKRTEHEKLLQQVPLEKLKESLDNIRQQLNNSGDKKTISITQEGTSKEYPTEAAREFYVLLEDQIADIEKTEQDLRKLAPLLETLGNVEVGAKDRKVRCKDLEQEQAKWENALAEVIKKNEGKLNLRFQNTALQQLELQLAKLEGRENKTVKIQPSKPKPKENVEPMSMKDVAAAVAARAGQKKSDLPSISKL